MQRAAAGRIAGAAAPWIPLHVALVAAACASTPPGSSPAECRPAYAAAAALLDSAVAATGAAGGALVVLREGAAVCESGAGALSPDDAVPLASASKWLSAAAVLALADEGRLSLDDPLSARVTLEGAAGRVTLRQALSHTSGLAPDHPCLGVPFLALADCARMVAEDGVAFPAGSAFRYGGGAYQLAGAAAEAAAGEPWGRLFDRLLARPLGMRAGAWGTVRNPVLAGGARASARDYARFLEMLRRGGTAADGRRVLSPASVRETMRDQLAADVASRPRSVRGYGLGAWIEATDDAGNATEASAPGDTGVLPWIDLPRGVVAVVVLPRDPRLPPAGRRWAEDIRRAVRRGADAERAAEGLRPAGAAGN